QHAEKDGVSHTTDYSRDWRPQHVVWRRDVFEVRAGTGGGVWRARWCAPAFPESVTQTWLRLLVNFFVGLLDLGARAAILARVLRRFLAGEHIAQPVEVCARCQVQTDRRDRDDAIVQHGVDVGVRL